MQINKRQTRQPDTIEKLLGRPHAGPKVKSGPVIPSHCGEHVSPGKLKNPVPTVKNHTGLDDGIGVKDKSITPVGHRKSIFWQTSINDQRIKQRVYNWHLY